MPLHSDQWNQLTKSISGSLSAVADTEGYTLQGLAILPSGGTLAPGTLQFRVGWKEGEYYPLNDGNNARVGLPFGANGAAFSYVAVQAIRPYRYIVCELTTVQNAGNANVIFPVKL